MLRSHHGCCHDNDSSPWQYLTISFVIAIFALCHTRQQQQHKQFQVALKEGSQEIEVLEAWPSNISTAFNPSSGMCSREVITPHSQKIFCCTIMPEPHVVELSGRYSLQKLQKK
ncbi:hypothetical protein TNCV_2926691 [Trichonephila clavipes]|nr:hypothetical protein TNCV_2926691 [Trichonephila clavipes]